MRDACGPRDVADFYQPAWATGYVTCCEMDGSAAERNSQRLGGACSDLKTFAQAKAFCAAGGMRLCKPSELREGCGPDCGYDSVAVWTTEPGFARGFVSVCLVCLVLRLWGFASPQHSVLTQTVVCVCACANVC